MNTRSTLGANGLALIKHFESCCLFAFKPIPTDPWTIGWGRTAGVKQGDTCTQAEADAWLAEDVAHFAADVTRLVKVSISQNQFDALVSFAYNVGLGDSRPNHPVVGLAGSTLLELLNHGRDLSAANEFMRWNKSKGVVVGGLTRRRDAERRLFITPDGAEFKL